MIQSDQNKKLALVLSGGGARGAYEAGVINYIRTMLPLEGAGKRQFDILCGSSIGAINVCYLAATSHNLEYQGRMIFDMWNKLDQSNIYKRDVGTLTRFLWGSVSGVLKNIFYRQDKKSLGHRIKSLHFQGLLNASPLPHFLRRQISWKQIALNIQNGNTKALALTVTNVHTGRIEHFISKHPSITYTGRYRAHYGYIEVRHALASAAIPILFPSVRIGSDYYCDGGLRLNTPMSPAIHMGAKKVLVIGLHHDSEKAKTDLCLETEEPNLYPSLGEVMGKIFKTVLVDQLDYDLAQLERINQIIEHCEEAFGADFLEKLNQYMEDHGKQKDFGARGLNKINTLSIFPSMDMRKIFSECLGEGDFLRKNLTMFERFILRVLDVDITHSLDFLSFILFIPTYLKKLLELGFEDARKNRDKLIEFFSE